MKTALIMGVTGGFGGAVARSLHAQGWSLRALMRQPERLPADFSGIEIIQGDASVYDDVATAAEGVDVIVYGVNPGNYDWNGKAVPWLEQTAAVAEERGITIVFPGNVYVLNPADGPIFDESAPIAPVSGKGRIRQAQEARLLLAAQRGARVIILRCGDFIGADAPSTWMQHLVKPGKQGYTVSATGNPSLPHTWAYLPDVAQVVSRLLAMGPELAAFEVCHFKGLEFSFQELAETVQKISGKPVRLKKFSWAFFKMFAAFSRLFSGLLEMRYLWDQQVHLSDRKLRGLLQQPVSYTPLDKVLPASGLVTVDKKADAGASVVVGSEVYRV